MYIKDKNIVFGLTGSFCTFKNTILQMKELVKAQANILPVMSYNAYKIDSRFGKAKEFITEIEDITSNKIIHTIQGAEPIGPKQMTDIMIIAPCTGNTISKLSMGIADTPVLFASKLHLINRKTISNRNFS